MIINFQNIPMYSIFIIVSLAINCIVIFWLGNKQKIDKNIILCSLVYEVIGIIVGAKLLNLIQVEENTSFYYAGFSAYGGVIGGIFALIIFSKIYKVSLLILLNVYIPVLPLLYSISKLGCFFSGCCYGIKYNGPFNIIYKSATEAPIGVNLFPVQIVETIMNFFIFIYILYKYKENIKNTRIIQKVFILCGICKFSLEFLRYSWNGVLSSTQVISIIFIVLGLIFTIIDIEKNRRIR